MICVSNSSGVRNLTDNPPEGPDRGKQCIVLLAEGGGLKLISPEGEEASYQLENGELVRR